MFHKFRIPVVAACLFAAVPAAAQVDWALDIQPAECTLNRAVMEPAPLLIGLWTLPGSDLNTLVIASRDLPEVDTKSFTVTVSFAEGTPGISGQGGVFPVRKEAGRGIAVTGLGADFLDGFAKASSVRITIGSKTYGPFAYSKAGGAVRAFRRCVSDQLVEWGADATQFAAGGKTPQPLASPKTWLSMGQLGDMAGREASFRATFRLSVSTEGQVDGCAVVEETADKRAEKVGCSAVMTRKLFTPALDAQGKPVRGVYAVEVGIDRRANRRR